LPEGYLPQVVFHGSEPLLNKRAVFAAISRYSNDFRVGLQTNGSLLGSKDIEFLISHQVAIGLSLDGHTAALADANRRTWRGQGVSAKVVDVIGQLREYQESQGYRDYSVICTVTNDNVEHLVDVVELLHDLRVPTCMLNPVRCTQESAREAKPSDELTSRHYLAALDRTYDLYRSTGRKLVVANFANVLLGILAPQARKLMCDISPCGAGRCFLAISAQGEMFPCSEFLGLPEFCGGSLGHTTVDEALASDAFTRVSTRAVEGIQPCATCAIRNFCGAPCPAEAHAVTGTLGERGAFCDLYAEQVRYAFRQIAVGRDEAYLWDGWEDGTTLTLQIMRGS
jgi:uncharacterized protein